ncbi:hypothetical protein NDU88_002723 [Pleurodeles waltl]|uniref:Uncharacterized protein n=1 Tax=Pleurodeles waltl TaxID=8319 RepID=A0AAV7M1H8_PLEWA|nr:hypothetical protein NDU88_002723 [Pleurodeles waltl]
MFLPTIAVQEREVLGFRLFKWVTRCLLRNRCPGEKIRLPFELMPWTVERVRGTMATATKGHESVTRNSSFFKRYLSENTPADAGTTTQLSDSNSVETSDDFLCTPGCGDMTPEVICKRINCFFLAAHLKEGREIASEKPLGEMTLKRLW